MKMRKIFAGMAAAAISMTMVLNASAATYLFDKVQPDMEVAEGEKGFYDIGAMPFFMSQKWNWNQGDWVSITEEGIIDVSYEIDEAKADTTLSGKGTLGDMGIMIMNLPDDGYPYNVEVLEANYTTEDGEVIEFERIKQMNVLVPDSETGSRIHIRPQSELDDDGNPKAGKIARPEVAGWEEEGGFKAGTLHIKLNLDVKEISGEEDTGDDAIVDSGDAGDAGDAGDTGDTGDTGATDAGTTDAGTTDAGTTDAGTTDGGTSGGSTTTTTTTGNGAAQSNTQTGAASNAILASMALAAAGVIASKKRK